MGSLKSCSIILLGYIACSIVLPMQARANNDAVWDQLNHKVETRRIELNVLISEANQKGINTDYASVSEQVISAFQMAAQHDRENVERVRRIFQTFSYYNKTDPMAADQLAFNELKACLDVADHAAAELRRQLAREITLSDPPDFTNGMMELAAGYYRLDGRAVFPSSLVWMPKEEEFMQAFGRLGEGYYTLGGLKEDGTLDSRVLKRAVASLENQCQLNAAPLVFFMGHAPAGWMKRQHPEIMEGARHFTQYDIDSPLIRAWIKTLCARLLPGMSQAGGNRPMAHLLANEPHFATQKGGWRARNGLSKFGMQKYRHWVAVKYKTVEAVNDAYNTSYKNLDQVKVDLPINPALRGGVLWYDWCRFNMDRVNEWFTFLKQQVQANDLFKSPVTIKMLGFTLSTPLRDHGLDIEYLTKLQDIPGADLRVAPYDAIFYGKHEEGLDPETGWLSRYAYDWVEQSMYLDFTKSICPDKLFYDSEWHGFGAVSWRHFNLSRDYVRSALWLAFSHGMGAIKPWLWGRGSDGSLKENADHIGELATQPVALDAYGRTLKELNAHAERVASATPRERFFIIYYCEEAAIQDENYTGHFKDIYEALKLLNLPVGFTTPSEIGGLDARKQILIIPPTRFIADDSLARIKTFQHSGGRVVLVDVDRSFLKNEVGVTRSGAGITKSFATLPLNSVLQMAEDLDSALAPVKPAMPMDVAVTDLAGKKAYGVIIHQSRDPKTQKLLLVLNNVSKDQRAINFKLNGKPMEKMMDVITRRLVRNGLKLEPCDVRMLNNID